MTPRSHSALVLIALVTLAGLPSCASSPGARPQGRAAGEGAPEGQDAPPASAPFAAVFPEKKGEKVVVLVVDRVNPKMTPRYFDHPSIRALTRAFANYLPRRVSVEAEGGVEALMRRVGTCEAQVFRGPCPENVYAASLAKRKSASLEGRAPGSPFVEFMGEPGARGAGVVLVVLAPDAFARERGALDAKLGSARYFTPSP